MNKLRTRYCLDHLVFVKTRRDLVYREWWEEHFGPQYDPLKNYDGVWAAYLAGAERIREEEFRFKNRCDAFLFKLKWS